MSPVLRRLLLLAAALCACGLSACSIGIGITNSPSAIKGMPGNPEQ